MVKGFGPKSFVYFDTNPDISSTIFLAGSGRSGTTWLSEILHVNNKSRYMFEPFYPKLVRSLQKTGIKARQYIDPSDNNPHLYSFVKKILEGRIRHYWIDRFNARCISNNRLIKDIRANLLLRWMHRQFSDMPIIFIMRHPFPIALSRLRMKWGTGLEDLLQQDQICKMLTFKQKNIIDTCQNDFEKSVCAWAIENMIPLKQFKKGEIYPIFYENLCIDPLCELENLFVWLNKPLHQTAINRVGVPSETTKEHSAIVTGSNKITTWKKHISPNNIERGVSILKTFNLDTVYDNSGIPLTNNPFIT